MTKGKRSVVKMANDAASRQAGARHQRRKLEKLAAKHPEAYAQAMAKLERK